MKHDFHDRFTNAVIHTEIIPDDSPNPVRAALEQAVIRGQAADELRLLRGVIVGKIAYAVAVEAKLLGHLVEAIDGELAIPSESANLESANLARANLARAYLESAYLESANLESANLESANLESANLESANLESANLESANLESANLESANLASAYLARANLESANLESANLASANLARANLARANLASANLARANLARANLARAYLESANLESAYGLPAGFLAVDPIEPYEVIAAASLAEHARRYRERHPEVPAVIGLDAKILESITTGGGKLHMADWHTCDTTHCRGGWAVHHAGKKGYDLEREVGVERAAAMIYMASTGRVPHFFGTDEQALSDIKRWANVGQE